MTNFRKFERNLKSHREPKCVRNSSKSVTFRKKNQNTPIILLFWKVTLFQTGCHLLSPKVTISKLSIIMDVTKVTPKVTLFLEGTIFVPNCLNCCWLGWRHRFFFSSHIWFFLACEEKQARKKHVRERGKREKNEKKREKSEH